MSNEAVQGLDCPRCGGMVPVPEGQVIVICPYCEQRSVVSASSQDSVPAGQPNVPENQAAGLGVRRYQAPLRVQREQAVQSLQSFLSGKIQIARDAARAAQLQEAFLVHLPFWAVWGRGIAYAFGQVKVGSGDNQRWEPREKKVARELTWNSPACEVGEFGVWQVPLKDCPLEPFRPDDLHRSGMVFEPVGSENVALETARQHFEGMIGGEVQMGQTAQLFTRLVRVRLGVVYYPLWVLRYLYHGRAFQVVTDGVNGQVIYGKAPGSVVYRAAALVIGMAVGAVTAIDIPALILSLSSSSDDTPFVFALIVFAVGLGIMYAAYRAFRYAEHHEYHRFGKPEGKNSFLSGKLSGQSTISLSEISEAVRSLEKFQ